MALFREVIQQYLILALFFSLLFTGFLSEDGMTRKEFIKAKCMQLLFGWECSPCWHKFAHIVELFIMDAFVDLFITLCIVINTIFMAIDHYEMDKKLEETLITGNYVSFQRKSYNSLYPIKIKQWCVSVIKLIYRLWHHCFWYRRFMWWRRQSWQCKAYQLFVFWNVRVIIWIIKISQLIWFFCSWALEYGDKNDRAVVCCCTTSSIHVTEWIIHIVPSNFKEWLCWSLQMFFLISDITTSWDSTFSPTSVL